MQPILEIPLADGRDYIELCDLLKIAGLSDSGGAAKRAIADGAVTVDGVAETRKRRKVRRGQVAAIGGRQVTVVGPEISGGSEPAPPSSAVATAARPEPGPS